MPAALDLRPVQDTSGLDLKPFVAYEKALRKRVDKGKIPGYCSAVIYKGELLHSDAYGYADPDRRVKYGPDTIVRLYCMSKPFVAVCILMLQERGLLSLKDPVSKYIPSFRGVGLAASSKSVFTKSKTKPKAFSIMHCLTHTAGLPYGSSFNEKPSDAETQMCHQLVQGVEEGKIASLQAFVDELARLPLRLVPGKEYHYSFGLDVLGRVIEVVSGMKLSKFLEKEVFRPLKMRDTAFYVPRSKGKRLAALYCGRASAIKVGRKASELPKTKEALCRVDGMKPEQSRWMQGRQCAVESGGGFQGANMGGLVSTLSDSARFMAMLVNGGILDGTRLLSEKSVKRYCLADLFTQGAVPSGKIQRADGKPFGWSALGEIATPRTKSDPPFDTKEDFELGETGGGGAACTYWSVNPTRDLAILWFTQSMDNDPYVTEEENIYVAARKAAPVNPHYVAFGKKVKTIRKKIIKAKSRGR